MTTTFHFETTSLSTSTPTKVPMCSSAARAWSQWRRDRHPHSTRTSPERGSSSLRSAGSEYWQGLGEVCRVPPRHPRSKRERQCGRMPWRALRPLELAETSAPVADCVYALVDPTNGRVELGRAGHGTTALIFDGSETRLVQPAPSESGVGHSTSFELAAGSTLLLLTHDPAEREGLTSAIQRALAARSAQGDQVDAVLECCLELRKAH